MSDLWWENIFLLVLNKAETQQTMPNVNESERFLIVSLLDSYLLHCGNLAASSMQGSPQGWVSAPCLALQNLLLNLVQMLHHVPRQALLGADEHLNHLQTHMIIKASWFSERERVQKGWLVY